MNITNLLTLFAPPVQPNASGVTTNALPGSSQSTSTSSPLDLGALMFGQLLAAKWQPTATSAAGQAGTIASQLGQTAAQLKTQIPNLLQSGVSMEQIVNTLAQTLGSNVLTQLQQLLGVAPGTSAQDMLTQLLTQVLGPPTNGPPQT